MNKFTSTPAIPSTKGNRLALAEEYERDIGAYLFKIVKLKEKNDPADQTKLQQMEEMVSDMRFVVRCLRRCCNTRAKSPPRLPAPDPTSDNKTTLFS